MAEISVESGGVDARGRGGGRGRARRAAARADRHAPLRRDGLAGARARRPPRGRLRRARPRRLRRPRRSRTRTATRCSRATCSPCSTTAASTARCSPAPRWARTRSCASRSTTATASPAWSSSRPPSTRTTRRTRSAGSTAGTRSSDGLRERRRGGLRRGLRRAEGPRAAGTRRSSRSCASGSSRTRIPRRWPTRCARCRARGRSRPGPSSPSSTLPTVVVASRDEADPEHPYAVGERYAEAIPGARLVTEEPGQLAARVAGQPALAGDRRRGRATVALTPGSERRHPRHQHDRALDHGLAVVRRGEAPVAVLVAAGDEAGAVAGPERDLGPRAGAAGRPAASGRRGSSRPPRSPRRRARRRSRAGRRASR